MWPRLGQGHAEAVEQWTEGALEMEQSPQGGGLSGLRQGSCSGWRQGPGGLGKKSQRHGGRLSLSPSD